MSHIIMSHAYSKIHTTLEHDTKIESQIEFQSSKTKTKQKNTTW